MLVIKILAKAHLFPEARTLNALKSQTYGWLADALTSIRANSSMDIQTKLGLLMANTTQGEACSAHIKYFVQDLD
jgi:hypothetical protein